MHSTILALSSYVKHGSMQFYPNPNDNVAYGQDGAGQAHYHTDTLGADGPNNDYTFKAFGGSPATKNIDGTNGTVLGDAKYSVKLDKKFGDDINFISDDNSGLSPTKINDGTIVNIYKYTKENSSKFDGRFFVKINVDGAFNENITVIVSTLYLRSQSVSYSWD